MNIRKAICLAVVAVAAAVLPAKAQTFTLSDIQYWVGTGTNQSAVVISWNDGITPDNLVFGYNWNMPASGTAPTLYNMLAGIQAANPLLQITANPAYDDPANGDYAVYSAFYNLTGGAGPTVGTPANLSGSDTETGSAPTGDHYAEGWDYNGFWGELIANGDPYDGGSWDSLDAQGVAVDTLSNDAWFGLSFSTDLTNYTIPNPGQPSAVFPVPVPEPSCLWLLAATGLLAAVQWKRRSA